jgi:hypothetical protein
MCNKNAFNLYFSVPTIAPSTSSAAMDLSVDTPGMKWLNLQPTSTDPNFSGSATDLTKV